MGEYNLLNYEELQAVRHLRVQADFPSRVRVESPAQGHRVS